MNPTSLFAFLRAGLNNWSQTASFLPSQRFLVQAMVDAADISHAKTVVEIGPGVGVITHRLLAALPRDAKLATVEIDASLNDILQENVKDERLVPICGSAEVLEDLLSKANLPTKVDAIVSSLGMSMFDDELRERILDAACVCLQPGGRFVQFGYQHSEFLAYSKERGVYPFKYQAMMNARFAHVERIKVNLNAPPAWVYCGTDPRATVVEG